MKMKPEDYDGEQFKRDTKHPETPRFPGEHAPGDLPKGRIYDKKPFKMAVEAGKVYAWCSCGYSKSQPLCDGTHKRLDGNEFVKTKPKFRPIRYTATESKEVYFCNCKQSGNRPFCDSTHKQQDIQDAVKS